MNSKSKIHPLGDFRVCNLEPSPHTEFLFRTLLCNLSAQKKLKHFTLISFFGGEKPPGIKFPVCGHER
ncbi:hypothetical protein DPC56_06165 [Methanothermobacter tenebrarum]|uniref:Uncharacterized protein n=1 Tax=Methanothermobacter tenebrarum TaxID=680118 RepID=A0A328P9L5_9EURY|nr:hypothetical protein DPC56_06165 [Methanothermobacter tenebrarum]